MKNPLWFFFIFQEIELFSSKLKKLLIFHERVCKAWKSKISQFLSVERELLNISLEEKSFLCFPYQKVKLSKSKYFLIIIMKRFFSFYNVFFYTQEAHIFHLLIGICNIHHHIVAFKSSLERFWDLRSFTSFLFIIFSW